MHICEITLTVSEQCHQTHVTWQGNVTSVGWVTAVTTSHHFDFCTVHEGLMLVVITLFVLNLSSLYKHL
jgi:hypothetical protein